MRSVVEKANFALMDGSRVFEKDMFFHPCLFSTVT